MKEYADAFLRCTRDSRAERYRNRLFEMITQCINTGEMSEIESIIMIFVSLLREREKDYAFVRKNKSESIAGIKIFEYDCAKRLLNNAEFSIKTDDGNLLKCILNQALYIPDELLYEKIIGIKSEISKTHQKCIRRHFYLVSAILLCTALQSTGAFSDITKGDL